LSTAESLVRKLEAHAATLGLGDDTHRLVTARTTADLVNDLTGLTDATKVVRALATAALPREGAIYRASLHGADEVGSALSMVAWRIVDQLPVLAEGTGPQAERARTLLDRLRDAARHDEHQVPLKDVLNEVDRAAIDLIIEPIPKPRPPRPEPEPEPGPDPTVRTVTAAQVAAAIEELRTEASFQSEDTVYEITWRIVSS
jgi:hypothetical protein